MQDCSNSIANVLELLQSCTKPSICTLQCQFYPYPSGLHHVTDLVPLKQPEQCRQIWEINFNSLRSVILNETESYAHGTLVGSSCRYHSYIPGNSLALERCGCNLELVIFKLISRRDILSISCEINIMWMVAHDSVVTWVSWHLHFDCLFNGLFSYKFCITGFLRGIHWWLLDSPHKELLMCKPFPCHNVIIKLVARERWKLDHYCPFARGLRRLMFPCFIPLCSRWSRWSPWESSECSSSCLLSVWNSPQTSSARLVWLTHWSNWLSHWSVWLTHWSVD